MSRTLHQPPHNCTILGAVQGAAGYLGRDPGVAALFGGSGQAFVCNIHRELCPSGPYCYDRAPIERLLRNLGLVTTPLGGCFGRDADLDQRAALEAAIRAALDGGAACYLINMEGQLILGHDDTGLLTAQPWPGVDFPPRHLTWGTWAELGDEVHCGFYRLDAGPVATPEVVVGAALQYAVALWDDPLAYTSADYGVGPLAWRNWLAAVAAGLGNSHGHWWNAQVWSECRRHAAAWLRDVAATHPPVAAPAQRAADACEAVAAALAAAGDKALPAERQTALLSTAAAQDETAVAALRELLAGLPA
ncbi:MAG: hypothetical protein IT204_00505 [Fimbriimonadaceae bacterium]|nr:hypothetical protein [Fimbriimonadaceae bacterium]